jgi:hypothetical protein
MFRGGAQRQLDFEIARQERILRRLREPRAVAACRRGGGRGRRSGDLTRVRQLGPTLLIAALTDLHQLSVVGASLRRIAGRFRGAAGAVHRAEAIRFLLQVGLELLQRVRRLVRLEEHLAEQFARRRDRSRCDRRLVGGVLERGRRGERAKALVLFALGPQHPGLRGLPLDVELRRPVGSFACTSFSCSAFSRSISGFARSGLPSAPRQARARNA